jgi:hypothetical protein
MKSHVYSLIAIQRQYQESEFPESDDSISSLERESHVWKNNFLHQLIRKNIDNCMKKPGRWKIMERQFPRN